MTAVVLAEAPGPGCLPDLAGLLDEPGRIRLQRALVRQAARWAAAAARGAAIVVLVADDAAVYEGGGDDPLGAGAGAGAHDPLGAAAHDPLGAVAHGSAVTVVVIGRADDLAAHVPRDRPVLLAGAAWPRLGAVHAAGAWADLDAGAGAVFGPSLDGGAYLVGLAAPAPERLSLPEGPAGLWPAVEAAHAEGLGVGLLRHERPLATAQDAAAFLADPLLASDLRAALGD